MVGKAEREEVGQGKASSDGCRPERQEGQSRKVEDGPCPVAKRVLVHRVESLRKSYQARRMVCW